MQNDIWAIFKHMIQDDSISMAEQHVNCPKYALCKYWVNNSNYDPSKRLPCIFADALKPIFTRLTNEDILQRCLKGFTQNQNESLNGTVWNRCPKTRFCGQQHVQVAVCEAVCQFKAGSGSVIEILSSLGSELSGNTYWSRRKTCYYYSCEFEILLAKNQMKSYCCMLKVISIDVVLYTDQYYIFFMHFY